MLAFSLQLILAVVMLLPSNGAASAARALPITVAGQMKLSSPDIPARGKAHYVISSGGEFAVRGKASSFMFGSHKVEEVFQLKPAQVLSHYYTHQGQDVDFDGLAMRVVEFGAKQAILSGRSKDGVLTFYLDLSQKMIDLQRVDFKASLIPIRLMLKRS